MPYHRKPKEKGNALPDGCKTGLSGPALWKSSAPGKTRGLCCKKKYTATTIIRFTQPPGRCPQFDLLMLKRLETACFDRLFCQNPISHPRMSSACELLAL